MLPESFAGGSGGRLRTQVWKTQMVIPKDETARWLIMPISAQAQTPGGGDTKTQKPHGDRWVNWNFAHQLLTDDKASRIFKTCFFKIINISLNVGYQGKENFTRMRPGQFTSLWLSTLLQESKESFSLRKPELCVNFATVGALLWTGLDKVWDLQYWHCQGIGQGVKLRASGLLMRW